MSHDDFKQSLLKAPRRKFKDVTVESLSGPVQLVIRRPADSETLALFEGAKRDKLIHDDGTTTSTEAGLLFRARMVALTLFAPNAVVPLFTEAEALAWPGLGEVADDCQLAFAPPGFSVEKAKGNSGATPS